MKDYKSLRIIFMGTPEFAVASLHKLINNECNVVAVVTALDKQGGRGMQLQQSAVKKYAVENNIPVLQPEKLKNPEFIDELKSYQADLQIVVAFRMLPEIVWSMPPMGSINLHGSLLPKYRGAAPINWAIINGEKETGVTTFKLQHQIDTGNILMQASFAINEDDDAGMIHDRMKEIGATVLLNTIIALTEEKIIETPQSELDNIENIAAFHAPKIFTETCKIDFTKNVNEVFNLIRGLSPYPAAFTFINTKKIKIFACKKIFTTPKVDAGFFETDQKTYLQFACNDGYIQVVALQMEGKKRMDIQEFLRGYKF